MIDLRHKNEIFSSNCCKNIKNICGCGEIGRRTRLRIWRREAWGFESLHPYFFWILEG
jgi:hypothetical protein